MELEVPLNRIPGFAPAPAPRTSDRHQKFPHFLGRNNNCGQQVLALQQLKDYLNPCLQQYNIRELLQSLAKDSEPANSVYIGSMPLYVSTNRTTLVSTKDIIFAFGQLVKCRNQHTVLLFPLLIASRRPNFNIDVVLSCFVQSACVVLAIVYCRLHLRTPHPLCARIHQLQ